jgi:formylmethanofuran dehydrogenase subunit D
MIFAGSQVVRATTSSSGMPRFKSLDMTLGRTGVAGRIDAHPVKIAGDGIGLAPLL